MATAAHHPLTNYQPLGLQTTAPPHGPAAWFGRTIALWRARIRERHAFDSIDERELRDLGLSRWDVERELSKPFWVG